MITDPISDMLTRLRNASLSRSKLIAFPYSNTKANILQVIKDCGFIDSFKIDSSDKNICYKKLVVSLRFLSKQKSSIENIKRISKPGKRVYVKKRTLPSVRSGMGIAIVSTSLGIMSCREAKLKNLGGELLCEVW